MNITYYINKMYIQCFRLQMLYSFFLLQKNHVFISIVLCKSDIFLLFQFCVHFGQFHWHDQTVIRLS